jgi:hypothetical protein
MGAYAGFVQLGSSLLVNLLTKPGTLVPTNADALPTYRVYGPAGALPSGFLLAGTAQPKDTGAITNATNASPIVVTSANHGLSTGARVTISGVGGNGGANGTFVVTAIDVNTFSLNGSAGTGAYTAGGTWNATGIYVATIAATGINGFASGITYTIIFNYTISGSNYGDASTFTVV